MIEPIELCTVYPIVYIFCVLLLLFLCFLFLSYFSFLVEILWVYLLQTLTRPHSSTWVTKGFKGLVACAKCNRDSYDSELEFIICFVFALLEDEQSLSVGVFV